jgi:signal transduction histidine kinase
MVAWANPSRRLNRVFFVFSGFVAMWLFSQWQAGESDNGLWWVRLACALAVGVILMIWLVKQTAADPESDLTVHLRKMLPWIGLALALIWICFTPYFIPIASTATRRLYGWGYFFYVFTVAAMVLGIFIQTLLQIRTLSGVRRLELQLLLLGSIAAAIAVVSLMILGAATGNSAFNRAQSVFVLAFYVATSWAIVTTRVLDARHMLVVGVTKLAQLVVTSIFCWSLFWLSTYFVPETIAVFMAVGGGLWFATVLEPIIRRIVGLHRSDAESRRSAYEVARRESRPEQLESAFVKVLQAWSKSDRAVILTGGPMGLAGCGMELPIDGVIMRAMRNLRWASPERLARERPTYERRELVRFLHENALGAFVISEGPALTALVGVGVAGSRRPFTYPQITQLLELASIIESALERAHFAVKVQHAEQLATVGLLGASLAHEIRNPLVTIKTFVQLLPQHHQDARFREKFFRLISDEVGRIDQLTEQLLDLASPRAYSAQMVELHPLLRASVDLVAAKATHKNIQFHTEFAASPDRAFTDASAAKQVMLNLCFNAIQAVESLEATERWVKVGTRNTPGGIEMIVADSGPGVPPEIRPRLFQPFHTTKSTGFGLGLAICSDILANLNASISVDPPAGGRGATFRVTFPCQPLSS